MGIYFGLRLPTILHNRMEVLLRQFNLILSELYNVDLIDSPKVTIELWKGFPLKTIGGKKLKEYSSVESLKYQLENWNSPQDFFGVSPYRIATSHGQHFSLHTKVNLNIEIDEEPITLPGYLSAPSEYQQIYRQIYLETFYSHNHYFDQLFRGKKKYQYHNRKKLHDFLMNLRSSRKFYSITAGRDISVNENVGKAIFVYRKNELDLFKDYINMARDYLDALKKTGHWKPSSKLSKNEAEIIAEDLKPYKTAYIFGLIKNTKFYQEKLPEFFKSQKVIIPVPPHSVTYYRENYKSLELVFLRILRQLSAAVNLSLQSRKDIEKRFMEALEKQKFNEDE